MREPGKAGLLKGAAVLLTLLAIGAAWVWTPLRDWIDLDTVTRAAVSIKAMPAAPLLAIGAYVAGGLVVFPVSLLILATIFAFGPVAGFAYSLLGSFLSGVVTFGIGKALGRRAARRIDGRRLLRLGRLLRRRGLIAMITVRLVPLRRHRRQCCRCSFNVRFWLRAGDCSAWLRDSSPSRFSASDWNTRSDPGSIASPFWPYLGLIVLAAGWIRIAWEGGVAAQGFPRLVNRPWPSKRPPGCRAPVSGRFLQYSPCVGMMAQGPRTGRRSHPGAGR